MYFVSCNSIDTSELFSFDVSEISDIKAVPLELTFVGKTGADMLFPTIYDNMIYSTGKDNSYCFYLTTIPDFNYLGQFCRMGRSGNEPISYFILHDFYKEDGKTKVLLFSYVDSRIFEWNITESVSKGKDVYDRILQLNPGKKSYIPVMFYTRLSDNELLLLDYNNVHSDGQRKIQDSVPEYNIYSLDTGDLKDVYAPYRHVDFDGEFLSPTEVLSSHDSKHPDKPVLASAMGYIPQLNIFDIETGKAKGYRLKGGRRLDPDRKVWHFTSAKTDGRYIYALYCGKDLSKDNTVCAEYLYVFDWEGRILKKYHLNADVYDLCLDSASSKLYFTNRRTDDLYMLDLKDFEL